MENKAVINPVQVAHLLLIYNQYRLIEVTLYLFHLNEAMKKVQKFKLLDCFNFNVFGSHVSMIGNGSTVENMIGNVSTVENISSKQGGL